MLRNDLLEIVFFQLYLPPQLNLNTAEKITTITYFYRINNKYTTY